MPTVHAPSMSSLPPMPSLKIPPPPTPTARSTPTTSTPPVLTRTATDATAPTPTTKITSYEQFLKQHQLPPATASGGATGTRNVPQVGVNASEIVHNLQAYGQGGGGTPNEAVGKAGGSLTSSYLAGLRARLEAAYEDAAGLAEGGLTVRLEITVSATGEVIAKRILRPSGNEIFDAAVQAALDRVSNVDPPPGGEEQTFWFDFQRVAPGAGGGN